MSKLFTKNTVILLGICIVAAVLRLWQLGGYPAGFHIDEASLGYNGYSMGKTGKDEHGNRMPLYIDMFGDNRPSGYHYLTVVPVALFGLNEFATRLPGAIFGIVTIFSIYFLTQSLFANRKISLLSAALLAIAPWHIVSSRASAEAIVALFFIITGMAIIVRSITRGSVGALPAGFLLLTVSFFFYHTPRIFVPLLLVPVAVFIWHEHSRLGTRFIRASLLMCTVVFSVSLLLIFVVKGGTGRFNQVNIFGSAETKLVMEEQQREDGFRGSSRVMTKLFHNKPVNYLSTFTLNYFDYFSVKYLFMVGGRPLWYKVPNAGLLLLVNLPFIIAGAVLLLTQKKTILKLPLVWLMLAPVVAAVTSDDIPNIQRSLVMFPMFEILAAYGLYNIFSGMGNRRNVLIVSTIAIFIFNTVYFLHQYAVHGSSHETIYRFNGFKEMVLAVKEVYGQYDHIIMTKTGGGIYPHVLFFMNYDPSVYQGEGSPKDPDFGGFGKFIFVPGFCPSIDGDDRLPKTGKILYVNSGTCKINPYQTQKRILREDGSPAFLLVYN